MIAPRHTERFDEVARLISESGFAWSRRSSPPQPTDATADVVLLDSIGELRSVFQLAEIAFIGGSIIPHGGQNILEPAVQGVCVITGAYTQNFAAVIDALLAKDALIQLPPLSIVEAAPALAQAFSELLGDQARRKAISARAQAVCAASRGATERTVAIIADLVIAHSATGEEVPLPAVHLTAVK